MRVGAIERVGLPIMVLLGKSQSLVLRRLRVLDMLDELSFGLMLFDLMLLIASGEYGLVGLESVLQFLRIGILK